MFFSKFYVRPLRRYTVFPDCDCKAGGASAEKFGAAVKDAKAKTGTGAGGGTEGSSGAWHPRGAGRSWGDNQKNPVGRAATSGGPGNAAAAYTSTRDAIAAGRQVASGDLNAIPAMLGGITGAISSSAAVGGAALTSVAKPALTAALAGQTAQLAQAQLVRQQAQSMGARAIELQAQLRINQLNNNIATINRHLTNIEKAKKILSGISDTADLMSLGITGYTTSGAFSSSGLDAFLKAALYGARGAAA